VKWVKKVQVKVKVWVLVIALLTRLEQQHFTISEVAADWHELILPTTVAQCGYPLPATADNWTRGAAHRHTTAPTAPISALGLHPVAHELLLISRPAEGRRLSWPEHTVGKTCSCFFKHTHPQSPKHHQRPFFR